MRQFESKAVILHRPFMKYIRYVLIFIADQIAGPFIVLILSGSLTAFSVGWWSGYYRSVPAHDIHCILTAISFFPVQVGIGALVGWALERLLKHGSMLWIWILPFIALCLALLTRFPARSVWGLKMLFFASAGYSLGAWLARKNILAKART
jgi:hypothetical protein